jgi:hypothetical protein
MGTPHKHLPLAAWQALMLRRKRQSEPEDDMDQPPSRQERSRENMLVIALVVLGGGLGLLFLDFITFGIVRVVLALAALIAIFGAGHYLLWGHALSQEVAAEREALRRQEESGEPPLTQAPADAIQDLTRTQGIQKK